MQPYIKHKSREILFREAVLQFLGVSTKEDTKREYCDTCKRVNPNADCSTCSKEFEKIDEKGKVIGKK